MTRFARAKGSKSSNLKTPEDSTPWEVMKEQLVQAKKESEDNKNREVAENQRVENYSNFLKEQKVQKRKATWCDFPEAEGNKKAKQQQQPKENKSVKDKNKSKKVKSSPSEQANVPETLNNDNVDNVSNKKKKKKHKHKIAKLVPESHEQTSPFEDKNVQVTFSNGNVDIVSNKKKKQKNKHKTEKAVPESQQHTDETDVNGGQMEQSEHEDEMVKEKKKNKKGPTNHIQSDQPNKQMNGSHKKKKIRGDKPTRRKEINDKSFQLIINGKEVELMRFDGFPIMKKDAERLNELKTNMMKKGIPKTEVNRTIKLERRRAEKALARLKRDVCYNCRKGGHNLSDCPDLKSNIPGVDAAEGICFKCGSTEHRQFECKVQRDKEFRFANCFICKEQGHIARQCPDNPKGLYPNGGCCKLCGDVTHLRKDCPTVQNQKEGTSIKLQTLDTGSNVEDIDLQAKPVVQEAPRKPKKIKF